MIDPKACVSHTLLSLSSQGSKLAGKSVQSAGLRGMPSLYLVYIDQADGTQLHAVAPDYVLQVNKKKRESVIHVMHQLLTWISHVC